MLFFLKHVFQPIMKLGKQQLDLLEYETIKEIDRGKKFTERKQVLAVLGPNHAFRITRDNQGLVLLQERWEDMTKKPVEINIDSDGFLIIWKK